jgi:hypothetical protein
MKSHCRNSGIPIKIQITKKLRKTFKKFQKLTHVFQTLRRENSMINMARKEQMLPIKCQKGTCQVAWVASLEEYTLAECQVEAALII